MKPLLILMLSLACSITAAQETVIDVQTPKSVVRDFESKTKKLRREFNDNKEAQRKAYRDQFSNLQAEAIEKLEIALDSTTRKGDLDAALSIRELVSQFKEKNDEPPAGESVQQQLAQRMLKLNKGKKRASDKAKIVSSYDFLGINRQWINSFDFMSDGSVNAHHDHNNATWLEMPEGYILFRYGPGSDYIVFRPPVDGIASGHSSGNGRQRHLKKKP